jgi:uncharacterized membrane protein
VAPRSDRRDLSNDKVREEPMTMMIRNPVEWGASQVDDAIGAVRAANHDMRRPAAEFEAQTPRVRRLAYADVGYALRRGFDDFVACRSDVLAICLIYPFAGLALAYATLNASLAPLLFPLVAGFAIVGPFLALGLYEASRRRETGAAVSWATSAAAFASPAAGAIWGLGLILTALFVAWLVVAMLIHAATMEPLAPSATIVSFLADVLTTPGGRLMMVLGCAAGAVFALTAFAISVISFPLLLDRKVRVSTAISASVRAVRDNPGPMLLWGMIVTAGLVLGSLPLLLGLIVVMPVLGHATWHLYRRTI